jgi:hypothetical protein
VDKVNKTLEDNFGIVFQMHGLEMSLNERGDFQPMKIKEKLVIKLNHG